MKQFVRSFFFCCVALFATLTANAQCQPDPLYADSSSGVYPTPTAGVVFDACINTAFSEVFTIILTTDPITIDVAGSPQEVVINKVSGITVSGLPSGISLSCGVPNCEYTPTNSPSCAIISGTPTVSGTFPIVINATANVTLVNGGFTFDLPVAFPGDFFPGSYTINVDANASNCSSVKELTAINNIKNVPNPFNGITNIVVNASSYDQYTLNVFNMVGKNIHTQQVEVRTGENNIPFDGSNLETGVYMYTLSNAKGTITQRMMVGK